MFYVYTEVMAQDDAVTFEKTRLIFSFYLHVCLRLTSHEVPPLQ